LQDAKARGYDRTLVLGDLIGYGADPNAVVDRIEGLKPTAIVRGNHDKIALGIEEADSFNVVARNAARWTLNALTPEHREWLAARAMGRHVVADVIEIGHGAPYDEDAYIFDELDGLRAISTSVRPLCLFGHTHYPVTFELENGSFSAGTPTVNGELRLSIRDG